MSKYFTENEFILLKASPIRFGTGVQVRYRMGFNDSGYVVHVEQREDNGTIHDGYLAQGVTLERANDIYERHAIKPFEKG